jgi:hypothetical protein
MKNLLVTVVLYILLFFVSNCFASIHKSHDASSPGMLTFNADSHIVGFQQSKVFFIQSDHALSLDFVAADSVAPQVRSRGTRTKDGSFDGLGRVEYPNLWPGITARYEADEQGIAESVYFIEPGANVEHIRFKYNSNVSLQEDGSLRHTFPAQRGWMTESKPIAWQDIGGQRVAVTVSFFVENNQVGFHVAAYDSKHALIIDPVYQWHTFHDEVPGTITEIAVDGAGNFYITGLKAQFSGAFGGSTLGEIDGTLPLHAYSGEEEMVIIKLNSSGEYQWHTYYGSAQNLSDETSGLGIALDSQNNVYVTGVSSNPSWLGDNDAAPLHAGGFAESVHVVKLNSDGEYQWHTFYGEYTGESADIVIDSNDNVYVIGVDRSPSWSGAGTPLHASSGSDDLFVVKLDSDGAYLWHTFYGPATAAIVSFSEVGIHSLAIDASDDIYVAGSSSSSWLGDLGQLPLHPFNDSSTSLDSTNDVYVLKLNSDGDYQWHTYYGHSEQDNVEDIAVDNSGNVYLTGDSAVALFDDVANPLHPHSGTDDNYVLKLNSTGEYQWHTYYGSTGSGNAWGKGIEVAKGGSDDVFILGASAESWLGDGGEIPVHAHSASDGIFPDQHILKLNSAGAYQWHTFYAITGTAARGITTDNNGNIYTVGRSLESWQGDGNVDPLRVHSLGNDFTLLKLADSDSSGGGTGGGSVPGNTTTGGGSGGGGGGTALLELFFMLITLLSASLTRQRLYRSKCR